MQKFEAFTSFDMLPSDEKRAGGRKRRCQASPTLAAKSGIADVQPIPPRRIKAASFPIGGPCKPHEKQIRLMKLDQCEMREQLRDRFGMQRVTARDQPVPPNSIVVFRE